MSICHAQVCMFDQIWHACGASEECQYFKVKQAFLSLDLQYYLYFVNVFIYLVNVTAFWLEYSLGRIIIC
jgi:hypothetical protein